MKFKTTLFFFIILHAFFSCTENEKEVTRLNHKIYQLQQKAKQHTNDSLGYYISQLKPLLKTLQNQPDSLLATQEFLLGNYFNSIHKDSAIYHYNQAVLHTKGSINKETTYFFSLAHYYKKNGDYLNSISILDKLEELVNSTDYENLAHINNQKQSIYKRLKNYKSSLVYNKKAIRYFVLAKDTSQLVNSLIFQSNLKYHYLNDKKEAYYLLDSVLTIPTSNQKHYNILKNQIYQCYGIFNFYDKNYTASYTNYAKALRYLNQPKTRSDSIGLANTYANIAEVCTVLKKYNLSKKYSDSVSLYSNVLSENLRKFHLQNKLQLAYDTRQDFSTIATEFDNLYQFINTTYEQRIDKELIALKEANKKEKELLIANQKATLDNYKLRKNQLLLFGVLGLIGLGILAGFLYYRQKQLKHEKDEIFMQQRLFRAQMNPHFTSNILYSIQNLIKEDSTKANKYLVKFSRLLRLNLENSMQDFTAIEKEIEVVAKYLDLQQLRYPNTFDYNIKTIDIDEEFMHIPPMLIQPFVENAIKHGFKNITYKGQIDITLSVKNNFVFCEIIDNGIGLQVTKNDKSHTSASTLLIKKLVKKLTHTEVEISNKPTSEGSGTVVQFYIPYRDGM